MTNPSKNAALFSDLTPDQSASVQGGCYSYYYRPYYDLQSYQPYDSYSSYSQPSYQSYSSPSDSTSFDVAADRLNAALLA